ncbi:hypothetical protein MSG_04147 [Mycobacterium shigaense]|uniref:Uncharacterized protein n=1 Tax=Mycobacterium shigaense TaxID=722731 RepID=A0A1Z4EMT8_9MYCO|nr:hypothetical protein MSG_04147 [Mycobacterium shigaense]
MTDPTIAENSPAQGLDWLRHRPAEHPALRGMVDL